MIKSILVAVSENGVIGKDNNLVWHLPVDLKFFKEKTSGHHIIMGRKTHESVGRPLPNRVNIVISRSADYKADGCIVVQSLKEAIDTVVDDSEAFICGGAEIYKQALDVADRMYLTRVHNEFEGDTFFPEFDTKVWIEKERVRVDPDEKNKYSCSFITYERLGNF
jgi:dihydrofolate reductase